MTIVQRAMDKLNFGTLRQLASEAARRAGEQPHVARWMLERLEKGDLPGLVRTLCESVLRESEVKPVEIGLRKAA